MSIQHNYAEAELAATELRPQLKWKLKLFKFYLPNYLNEKIRQLHMYMRLYQQEEETVKGQTILQGYKQQGLLEWQSKPIDVQVQWKMLHQKLWAL